MNLKISIAGICIEFISPYDFRIQEQFRPFLTTDDKTDILVRIEEKNPLPEFSGNPVFSAEIYRVFIDRNSVVWRCYYSRIQTDSYYAACSVNEKTSESMIFYREEGLSQLNHLNGVMYHIGWEKHLLNYKRFLLHASCIDTSYGGILFSGVSGIGKSTQADLWCRYEAATLINGDRPIVGKADSRWTAYGSPYAGSSKCYVNASVPVTALVFPVQGPSCRIRKLDGREAFHRILEQTTMNQWEQESVNKTCDLILDLIAEVPVYEMICTPDKDAVDCLKEVLLEDIQNAED